MFVAMLPAKFPVPNALPAKFEAWPNLSHLEKASVFIMVRTKAMTRYMLVYNYLLLLYDKGKA